MYIVKVNEVNFKVNCNTRLWCSDKILEMVDSYPDPRFWIKIRRFAENGFWLAERSSWPPVKLEWDQVYRIGFIDNLFRIIGFYEDNSKHDFIAINSFKKRGQRLSKSQRKLIDEVATIKKNNTWRKEKTIE